MRVVPERLVAGGDVLARDDDGRVVFVRGALPGDEVDVEVIESRKGFTRAVIAELHEASPDRIDPPCERRHQGCGGCDWQHLAVRQQLPAKVEIVRDAFRRIGKLPDAVITEGRAVSSEAYRTTIRVVGDEHGRAAYRREESNDTVPASGCLVAHPSLEALLDDLRITPGLEVSLRVSESTGALTARWNSERGAVDGLPDGVYSGRNAFLVEQIAGVDLQVSAAAFFQSGPEAAELLVDAVRRAAPELDSAEVVLDAYSGVGMFAATVTNDTAHVITVESNSAAVTDCRVNLTDHAERTCDVVKSEFSRWKPAAGRPIDVVVADPARSGLAKPGVRAVLRAHAPVIVLVNCDPVSAARDAGLLLEAGYRHDGTEVLDLFPHTHHVETVSRYVRDEGKLGS